MNKNKRELIFSIIGIIFPIFIIIILIIINSKKPNKLKEIEFKDIYLSGLIDFNFIEDSTLPDYTTPNLGTTGNPILFCYIGTCTATEIEIEGYDVCDNERSHCEKYYDSRYVTTISYELRCSEECYWSGKEECTCFDNSKGECSRKNDDEYEKGNIV